MDRDEVEVNINTKKNEASIQLSWRNKVINENFFSARVANQNTGCASSCLLTEPAIKYDDYYPDISLIVYFIQYTMFFLCNVTSKSKALIKSSSINPEKLKFGNGRWKTFKTDLLFL